MSDIVFWIVWIFLTPMILGLFLMWLDMCQGVIEEIKKMFFGGG